jgi:hypothetical protein
MDQSSDATFRKLTLQSPLRAHRIGPRPVVDLHHVWTTLTRLSLGADHLPRDAIETDSSDIVQTAYGKGIVDEAMQWNRDRESSSVDSSSDSGVMSTADSSGKSSRGLDPSTLYFKKEDVIMLVDGELHKLVHRSGRCSC